MDAVTGINQTLNQYRRARAAEMLLTQARNEINETLTASRDRGRFSYKRLLTASGEMDWNRAPIEKDVSDALAREYGREPRLSNGAFVPVGLQRDATVGTASAGGYLVSPAQELRLGVPGAANSILDLCTVVRPGINTGAQRVGKFTALPTVYVLASESTSITEASPTVGQSLLAPSNATAYLEQSRQFALQSEGGAQALASLLTNALRTHVGVQILEGSGSNGEVTGLINDSVVATSSGTTLAWSTVCTTLETVEKTAGDGDLAWVVTAPAAKILRQRAVISGGDAILDDGKIGGYPVVVIGGTTNANAAFGKWKDLLVYEWAPLEIAVNPFAAFSQAIIGVRAWLAFNAAPIAATSFATITSIT